MSIKKILLTAGSALALVAFAAPASASAAEWLYEGKPVKKEHTVHFTRTIEFIIEDSIIVCDYHPTWTVTEPGKSEFTQMNITTKTCKATGIMDGCEMVEDTMTGGPWPVKPDPTLFTIEDFTLHTRFKCGEGEEAEKEIFFDFSEEALKAVPDIVGGFSELEISGAGTANGNPAELFSEIEVTEGGAGKFGIG